MNISKTLATFGVGATTTFVINKQLVIISGTSLQSIQQNELSQNFKNLSNKVDNLNTKVEIIYNKIDHLKTVVDNFVDKT